MSNIGYIHSTESFGASDGPGVRFIIFLKGCNLRCKYCHNPDTWCGGGAEKATADELITKALRYKSYWKSEGGITVSGGEPLLQIDFLIELLKKAKENGINTCIDTAGEPFSTDEEWLKKFNELMKYTDLVMLDIKHIDSVSHKDLTGKGNENILKMAKYLSKIGKSMWIRHVLVPEYTDSDENLKALKEFIDTLSNVERIELLPYHTLGRFKWENLDLEYELDGISPPTDERIQNAKKILGIN